MTIQDLLKKCYLIRSKNLPEQEEAIQNLCAKFIEKHLHFRVDDDYIEFDEPFYMSGDKYDKKFEGWVKDIQIIPQDWRDGEIIIELTDPNSVRIIRASDVEKVRVVARFH